MMSMKSRNLKTISKESSKSVFNLRIKKIKRRLTKSQMKKTKRIQTLANLPIYSEALAESKTSANKIDSAVAPPDEFKMIHYNKKNDVYTAEEPIDKKLNEFRKLTSME